MRYKDLVQLLNESKKQGTPKIVKRLASQIQHKSGYSKDRAYAAAISQLQKRGVLKSGSKQLTKKGKKRNAMSAEERAKDRESKRQGKKTSEFVYSKKTNRARLKHGK